MNGIDEPSLYGTVMNATRHLFFGGTFTPAERDGLVTWILAHQNRQRGFSFYPTTAEREHGIRLLSGEKPRTTLAVDNAVEMETLRLLALLQPDAPQVRRLFETAEQRLSSACYGRVCAMGECAHASISVLRYHAARGTERSTGLIACGLDALRQNRTGEGRWRAFPFYYTLLWLTELPDAVAGGELAGPVGAELSYARDRCQRLLSSMKPLASEKPSDQVREKILRDTLAFR